MSIRQASTPPALGVIARFGKGEHVVDTGQQDGAPAVFVRPARQPGIPGESANREQGPLDQLEPDEFVLIASSAEHAKAIADALCGSALPAPGVREAMEEADLGFMPPLRFEFAQSSDQSGEHYTSLARFVDAKGHVIIDITPNGDWVDTQMHFIADLLTRARLSSLPAAGKTRGTE